MWYLLGPFSFAGSFSLEDANFLTAVFQLAMVLAASLILTLVLRRTVLRERAYRIGAVAGIVALVLFWALSSFLYFVAELGV
jgi:hypothetical protein